MTTTSVTRNSKAEEELKQYLRSNNVQIITIANVQYLKTQVVKHYYLN